MQRTLSKAHLLLGRRSRGRAGPGLCSYCTCERAAYDEQKESNAET